MMEDKDLTVKDLIEKDGNKHKLTDFVNRYFRSIVVVILLGMAAIFGYRQYREYQERKQVEEMVQEKIEEIMDSLEEGQEGVVDDFALTLQDLDLDKIREYLQSNEQFNEVLSPEEMEELLQLFNQIDHLDLSEFFSASGNN